MTAPKRDRPPIDLAADAGQTMLELVELKRHSVIHQRFIAAGKAPTEPGQRERVRRRGDKADCEGER